MPEQMLVLWDVDHTLLASGGVGRRVFAEAFEAATGTPMSAGMATASGHTEPVLLEKTLRLNGITSWDGAMFERFSRAQVSAYRKHAREMAEQGRVLPGVHRALDALGGCSEIVQSVLTGNTREAAEVKLSAFGLLPWLDLEVGAYGDDDRDRPALVAVARRRAEEKLNEPFAAAQVVLIGDTVRDVEAARSAGTRVIAVASGSSSLDELSAVGPDHAVEALVGVDVISLVRGDS